MTHQAVLLNIPSLQTENTRALRTEMMTNVVLRNAYLKSIVNT
eukprot:CAMPEP_0116985038 /NCGR_PEP_ID=MMETSP0467-20121206/61998_1 /TAXON_ID=283647 /ORGANISM="Mesodinium pulex, Strain SPMC105" /LENGTH=42 /DNA_ID= /DNA_START= /DNA_END= /DNA_ORIENTATION=